MELNKTFEQTGCISCTVDDPEALFAMSVSEGIAIYPKKEGTYTLTIKTVKGKKLEASTKVIIRQ